MRPLVNCRVLFLLFLFWPIRAAGAEEIWSLQITNPKTEKILWETAVRPGDSFTLDYVHSSDHTPVQDRFRIGEDGGIVLEEERYLWSGAGLDSHPPDGTLDYTGRWTRVRLHRAFPRFLLRVGEVAGHRLTVNGKTLPLLGIAKGRERVWIHVTKNSNPK
ncbi:MAG: DUF1850 domain-containing protein [Thermodesulfobacteriota bacterium]